MQKAFLVLKIYHYVSDLPDSLSLHILLLIIQSHLFNLVFTLFVFSRLPFSPLIIIVMKETTQKSDEEIERKTDFFFTLAKKSYFFSISSSFSYLVRQVLYVLRESS